MLEVGVLSVCLIWCLLSMTYGRRHGANTGAIRDRDRWKKIKERLVDMRRKTYTQEVDNSGKMMKEYLNSLGSEEFKWYATAGTNRDRKEKFELSRGTGKLEEIISRCGLRFSGDVLSLCSGRGGWDWLTSKFQDVHRIYSVTYGSGPGRMGHEDYSKKHWRGKEKITVITGDAREVPEEIARSCHWIMFDGGEKHNNYVIERDRFLELVKRGCLRYINRHHQFVIKILTPHDHRLLGELKNIRNITGRGNFILLNSSKNSNQELYFVSTKSAGSLFNQVQELTRARMQRIIDNEGHSREEVAPVVTITGGPDYADSMRELHAPINMPRKRFALYEDCGAFSYGKAGGTNTNRVLVVWELLRDVIRVIPGLSRWERTNTTPSGFKKLLENKIDVPPIESSPYYDIMEKFYESAADYFVSKGVTGRVLSDDEIMDRANMQGAPAVQDIGYNNVGEFLNLPNWHEIVDWCGERCASFKPVMSIINTSIKPEKKEEGSSRGGRMVAYLPIPMRILELKYLGAWMDFVKPSVMATSVGGLGLHDFGQVVAKTFRDTAVCLDIAGWDTKVSKRMLEFEENFLVRVGFNESMVRGLYAIYKYPRILVPFEEGGSIFSRVLQGCGQRMSGTQVTYAGNTFGTVALVATTWCAKNPHLDIRKFTWELLSGNAEIGMLSSGDDHFVTGNYTQMRQFSRSWDVYNSMGFLRKDIGLENDSPIVHKIEAVEFCSHNYERVYYSNGVESVYRYQPTRRYSEIFGKMMIWLKGDCGLQSASAWAAAQGVNALLNYHHMRDCRRMGYGIRAVVPRNLVLSGTKIDVLNRPWLTNERILDVLNSCLFGESSYIGAFKMDGTTTHDFRLNDVKELGFISLDRELLYSPSFNDRIAVRWRAEFQKTVDRVRRYHGGDGDLSELERYN